MNKTLLVIGSGPGIGFATAQRFAQEGYDIVLSSRNLKNLDTQAAALAQLGAKTSVVQLDAGKPQEVANLITRIAAQSRLSMLYNAGVLRYDENGNLRPLPLIEHSIQELESDMRINLTSAIVAVQTAAIAMGAGGEGSIFMTGGGFGIHPSPDFLPISVGKAGIRAIANAMFAPLKDKGIHIGTVTVSQLVSPHSKESQDVANLFWEIESESQDNWTWERVY